MGDLYEQDFIGWTERQAKLLREAAARGSNLALDWNNLVEEVEGLGRSQYDAVASQVRRIILHLLKLRFSPAIEPRAGWRESIADARAEIEAKLEADPGLKPRMADMLRSEFSRAGRQAAQALTDYAEDTDAMLRWLQTGDGYSEEQLRGDWFPARDG